MLPNGAQNPINECKRILSSLLKFKKGKVSKNDIQPLFRDEKKNASALIANMIS